MPIIGGLIQWQNESVLFARSRGPILWENLFGSLLEFLLTIILVFYANRWIHSKARSAEENAEPAYSLVGERLDGTDQPTASETSI
jgi:hypothetical protein